MPTTTSSTPKRKLPYVNIVVAEDLQQNPDYLIPSEGSIQKLFFAKTNLLNELVSLLYIKKLFTKFYLLTRHVNADVGLKEVHSSKAVKMFVVDPAYTNSYEVVCSSCGVALANIVENEKCSSCAKDTINREDWVLPYNEDDYYINTNAAPTTTVFILRRMSSLAQLISNAQYYQDSLNNIENATK